MRIVLLGCPGAGKGTQAQYLSKHYNIPLISTGNMLRSAIESGATFSDEIKLIVKKGGLVSDDIVITLVKERLSRNDCRNGYLLDGFPRTFNQAQAMYNAGIEINMIIEIFVSDNEIVDRLSGRRIHPKSGRVYHLKYNPPITPEVDDVTQDALVQRDDDQEMIIRERLRVYHENTETLIQYYQNLIKSNPTTLKYLHIDGNCSIDQVHKKILQAILENIVVVS
jgi:adenylate kinase